MACARILDKAARREDCRVACMMGDGAMFDDIAGAAADTSYIYIELQKNKK